MVDSIHMKTQALKRKAYKKNLSKHKGELEKIGGFTGMVDREHKPISVLLCGSLFENVKYQRLCTTSRGTKRISTVWLGLDHSFGDVPPEIFESALIIGEDVTVVSRYCTEIEAVIGHVELVRNLESVGEEEMKLKVRIKDKNDFEKALKSLVRMEEVLGKQLILGLIGKKYPKKWSRRKRKKQAKLSFLFWKVQLLKDAGLVVTK